MVSAADSDGVAAFLAPGRLAPAAMPRPLTAGVGAGADAGAGAGTCASVDEGVAGTASADATEAASDGRVVDQLGTPAYRLRI